MTDKKIVSLAKLLVHKVVQQSVILAAHINFLMLTFLTEPNHQLVTESTLEAAKTFDKIKLTFDATLNIKLKFRDWQKLGE